MSKPGGEQRRDGEVTERSEGADRRKAIEPDLVRGLELLLDFSANLGYSSSFCH